MSRELLSLFPSGALARPGALGQRSELKKEHRRGSHCRVRGAHRFTRRPRHEPPPCSGAAFKFTQRGAPESGVDRAVDLVVGVGNGVAVGEGRGEDAPHRHQLPPLNHQSVHPGLRAFDEPSARHELRAVHRLQAKSTARGPGALPAAARGSDALPGVSLGARLEEELGRFELAVAEEEQVVRRRPQPLAAQSTHLDEVRGRAVQSVREVHHVRVAQLVTH
mmetsp:Transcript_2218/g.4744  ORF Transcript_2218/g.4744 Transcript_2218/m.4744 type:complete len:221 (-) Transcript_2218:1037-1699(-)